MGAFVDTIRRELFLRPDVAKLPISAPLAQLEYIEDVFKQFVDETHQARTRLYAMTAEEHAEHGVVFDVSGRPLWGATVLNLLLRIEDLKQQLATQELTGFWMESLEQQEKDPEPDAAPDHEIPF